MSKLVLVAVIAALCVVAVSAQVEPATCTDYCTTAMMACNGASGTGSAPIYLTVAGCMAICATFPPGGQTGTTSTGNNFACRAYHIFVSNSSTTAALTHCVHAGAASGSGVCGSTCDGYCNMMQSSAAITNLGGKIWPSTLECASTCANFLSKGTGGQTNPPVTSGNTAECRAYHISVSLDRSANGLLDVAAQHAMHATMRSVAGTCTNPLDAATIPAAVSTFCDRAITACNTTSTASVGQYSSRAQCVVDAMTFPLSNFTLQYQTSGNSIDCRTYHAGVASSSAAAASLHCGHTGVAPVGDTCGTRCAGYCNLAMSACTGTNAVYADLTSCLTICAGFTEGSALDVSDNTLGCRVYHSGVAATASAVALAHCPHVAIAGGYGVCGTGIAGFCAVQGAVCGFTGANSQYASVAACLTAAGGFLANGTEGATSGNTLQCRVYHLGAAASSTSAATLHCPHTASAPLAYCIGTATTVSSTGTTSTTGGSSGTTGGALSTATISVASVIAIVVAAVFAL